MVTKILESDRALVRELNWFLHAPPEGVSIWILDCQQEAQERLLRTQLADGTAFEV